MKTNIKNLLGIVGVLVILLFGIAALQASGAYSRSIEPSSFRSFTASGEGKVTAVPDIARFTFSVVTEGGTNLAELQTRNTNDANRVIDFIKSYGVTDEDIKTENYRINPRHQSFNCPRGISISPDGTQSSPDGAQPCPPTEIVGYTITNTVSVKVRDFDVVGVLLGGVVENGANSVSSLQFTIDDPSELQNQARELAIEKAKIEARSTARAGGFRIGKLISIDEGFATPFSDFARAEVAGVAQDSTTPSIEPGSEEIRVNVRLRYEIR